MFQAGIELGAAWQDLVGFLSELHALRIDLTNGGPHGHKKAHFVTVVTAPGRAPPHDHVHQTMVARSK